MEHLDDFIKGKLAQDPIAFSEAHWMKAAKMIEEQELQKRKRFVIWFFFGQLMFVLALVCFISFESDRNDDALSLPQSQTQIQASNSNLQTQSQTQSQSQTQIQASNSNLQTQIQSQSQTQASNSNSNLQIQTQFQSQIQASNSTGSAADIRSERSESRNSTPQPATRSLHPTIPPHLNPLASITPKYLDNKQENDLKIHPELYSKHSFRSTISIYAASSLYPYPQVGAKRLIAYTAGINYNIHLKKRWHIETGIHYRLRQGSFSNLQTTTQDSFAFRRMTVEHSLKASQLHTIEMPLAIVYATSMHQVHLGMNYARLLGVKGVLNKTNNQDGGSIEQIDKGWLEDESFKINRFELLLGYYFSFKPGFRVGAEAHYMLGGMLNNTTSSNVYLESKPVFIDFGVRYDIR